MSSSRRVAVVTGANKGIGFAIVRALCKKFDGDVYLTARNESLGKEAVASLEGEGLTPKFHHLDLVNKPSIEELKAHLQATYGGLDLLVNNAGAAYKVNSTAPFGEQAEVSVKTNYLGTLDVCNILFPILRPNARVVNMSSMCGTFALDKLSGDNRKRVTAADLNFEKLNQIMQEFETAAKEGKVSEGGWAPSAYGMSKVGVTAMSILQQKEFDKDSRPGLIVNACCPGYVSTDMSSFKGHLTPDQGAETPVYLALLPTDDPNIPKGRYVKDKKVQPWQA